jgi:aspartyl-tRNA synthetase
MPLRTHTCGQLRKTDENSSVTLCGWAANVRDHGGVLFIDLRDRYGQTQITFNARSNSVLYENAHRVTPESAVLVTGKVRPRPQGTVNPNLPTGEIEVEAQSLEVLGTSEPLPFELAEADSVDPTKRLKYRYIDLRRAEVQKNLFFRHRVIKEIRDYFDQQGFIEIETPYLTKSTPEGARDYLVPSRTYPGKFFALPQSPQMFKQILMIGGLDRYFQIAKCFRDEDLRADRQPEFTQLDCEMAFATEEDVIILIESLIVPVMRNCLSVEVHTPFPRISYAESLSRFGTDKPDTRFAMEIQDVTQICAKTSSEIFKSTASSGGVIRGLCVKKTLFSRKEIDSFTDLAKYHGAKGLVSFKSENSTLTGTQAKFFSAPDLAGLRERFKAEDGDTIFLIADKEKIAAAALGQLRIEIAGKLNLRAPGAYNYLWILHPPLFELDENGNLAPTHHPFTAPAKEDIPLIKKNPLSVRSLAYDIVLNGSELGSGSVRIHSAEVQEAVFSALGLSPEKAKKRFGFFLEALKFGTPPHAGIALGLDRFIAQLLGVESIRDVIAFPKTTSAACPLTDSPSEIDPDQLAELKLLIKEKDG